jgi:DNA polymerase-3 subunit gamma/tau
MMGRRAFAGEIAASAAVLQRDPRHGRLLLIRSARKLLGRFSPVLWEGDKDLGKLNPLIQVLEDDLDALERACNGDGDSSGALGASIVKDALKLEAEGIADFIPVAQIRRASYWGHLAPLGRRKLLVIENADCMKEEALNSLLKILEEPPERLTIVLCTARREGILPTLLSRLRPYHFMRRDLAAEAELIRRVFRDKQAAEALVSPLPASPLPIAPLPASPLPIAPLPAAPVRGLTGLEAYLDSFLPVNRDTLYPLAAFFVSSVALAALDGFRRRGIGVLPDELVALGKHCAPIAGSAGLGRPVADSKTIVDKVLTEARNFQIHSLFFSFLAQALDLVSEGLRPLEPGPCRIAYLELWKKHVGTAAAAGSLNQSPTLTLERLAGDLKEAMTDAGAGR